jgi:hypothetical protein
VKAAAAVLGASLLFFLGVLTGAGRRESVPPPAVIPLGAATRSGANPPAVPAPPATAKNPSQPKAGPSTATTPQSPPTDATAPTASTNPAGPGTAPESTATTATTATSTASSTTTTTESGRTQQVDGQVDCSSAGKRGNGKRGPCPSTTTSTGETPGGGGDR